MNITMKSRIPAARAVLVWLLPALGMAAEPMLTLMSDERVREVARRHADDPALVFTESREFPIRKVHGLPTRWEPQTQVGGASFAGQAQPGEFYVFQIGVYALKDCGPLAVTFTDIKGPAQTIPASALRCISLGGINHNGQPFTKDIMVGAGKLQALWVGVAVPPTAQGIFTGSANVRLTPAKSVNVQLTLKVDGPVLTDSGDSVAKNLSRLRWLDSTVGSEPTVTKPFVAVRTADQTVKVLGRELVLGDDGLPARIISYFSAANTRIGESRRDVLARPATFVVETAVGKLTWQSEFGQLTHTDTEAAWTGRSTADGLVAETTGRLDFTGSGEIHLHLTASRDIELQDARLEVPFRDDAARYFMGLHKHGGRRPAEVRWKWDVKKRQDCFWLGDVNAGLMLRFKDADYLRPPVNIYYGFQPLRLPASWGNGGQGGVDVAPAGDGSVLTSAYCGPRTLKQGESLDFIFELYLTPFRTLDTEKQWAVRFHHPHAKHAQEPMERVLEGADPQRGPNVINVHHANYHNPYINYPYNDASFPEFIDLVRRAHANGTKVRVYYTTREITQNMPELFPLHSMNGEIILPGPGRDARTLIHPNGPHAWLTENLREDFIPAWVDRIGGKYAELDLSVITTPDSRWHNFYLQGLQWLVEKSDLDGIYIDDTALDARSLQRARRILDTREGRYVDLHTWNHFNGHAGYANNLSIYMELLPYIDRLWLGEGFNASAVAADFWLVEMSGLPFGLMSEMLDGANPWRGMVFGETARLGWSGDPREMWRIWDEFGIQDTEFLPFFADSCPVKTDHPEILATAYRRKGRTFVALGSWAKEEQEVQLSLDWKAMGLDPQRTAIYAPSIPGMQTENQWQPGEKIPVAPQRGWFLVLDEVQREVTAPAVPETSSLTEVYREGFTTPDLNAMWKPVKSNAPSTDVASLANALQITAAANVHVGIEGTLPKGVVAVELEVDPGTDRGQTWGPGAALVWSDGKAAKLNARLEDMKFGIFADGKFQIVGGPIDRSKRYQLRILLADEDIIFQRKNDSGAWAEIGRLPRAGLKGAPSLLRVGKHATNAGWSDFADPGAVGECAIREIKILTR